MKLSPQELKREKLTKKKLDQCVTQIDKEGYVILEGVVPTSLLKEIRGAMDSVHMQHFRAHPTATKRPHAYGKGHGIFGVRAPKEMPFLDPRVVTNPMVVQILDQERKKVDEAMK